MRESLRDLEPFRIRLPTLRLLRTGGSMPSNRAHRGSGHSRLAAFVFPRCFPAVVVLPEQTHRSVPGQSSSPAAERRRSMKSSSSCSFLLEDEPVGTLGLIQIETLAVIAADAFARYDFRSLNRAPFALLFTDQAGIAFRPAFD